MTLSLRLTIVLPLALLAVVMAVLSSMTILNTLETGLISSLTAHLRSSFLLIGQNVGYSERSERETPAASSDSITTIVAVFGPDGTRISPDAAEVPRAFRDLPPSADAVNPPRTFREHSIVGLVFAAAGQGYQDPGPSSTAILMTTRMARRTYAEVQSRTLILSVIAVGLIVSLSYVVSTHLQRRIEELRRKVTRESRDGEPAGGEGKGSDVLDQLGADVLGAQEHIVNAQKEIGRLQIVRSQFLANVSHEVRTPLFSLKGFLETLLDGGIEDAEVNRAFVGKALHHAQRIDSLLRDLIDIARIESGEMRMSFRYFSLSHLIDPVREDYEDLALRRKQTFIVRIPSEKLEVLGDKERLRQALSNLLENAMKYSPEGSTVTLEARSEGQQATLSVTDNGPGIPPEHTDRIFERFYRIDADRSRELGGTGLGLAIVKHIVEAHGSAVRVTSQKGRGTSFSFTLKT